MDRTFIIYYYSLLNYYISSICGVAHYTLLLNIDVEIYLSFSFLLPTAMNKESSKGFHFGGVVV